MKGITEQVRAEGNGGRASATRPICGTSGRSRSSTYSGGMKQRFGIAQALLGNPKLIIVDEPTAGLDPAERNRFLNLLSSIGSQRHRDSFHPHRRGRSRALPAHGDYCERRAAGGRLARRSARCPARQDLVQSRRRPTKSCARWKRACTSSPLISSRGQHEVRVFADSSPGEGFRAVESSLEDVYFLNLSRAGEQLSRRGSMRLCSGSSSLFELKFRFKSLSTYVYFLVWFVFSFLDVAQRKLRPHRLQ